MVYAVIQKDPSIFQKEVLSFQPHLIFQVVVEYKILNIICTNNGLGYNYMTEFT